MRFTQVWSGISPVNQTDLKGELIGTYLLDVLIWCCLLAWLLVRVIGKKWRCWWMGASQLVPFLPSWTFFSSSLRVSFLIFFEIFHLPLLKIIFVTTPEGISLWYLLDVSPKHLKQRRLDWALKDFLWCFLWGHLHCSSEFSFLSGGLCVLLVLDCRDIIL